MNKAKLNHEIQRREHIINELMAINAALRKEVSDYCTKCKSLDADLAAAMASVEKLTKKIVEYENAAHEQSLSIAKLIGEKTALETKYKTTFWARAILRLARRK